MANALARLGVGGAVAGGGGATRAPAAGRYRPAGLPRADAPSRAAHDGMGPRPAPAGVAAHPAEFGVVRLAGRVARGAGRGRAGGRR